MTGEQIYKHYSDPGNADQATTEREKLLFELLEDFESSFFGDKKSLFAALERWENEKLTLKACFIDEADQIPDEFLISSGIDSGFYFVK